MTSELRKYCDQNISIVYRRFDEYKKHMEHSHVSKEVCTILHNVIVQDVAEIKKDVKELLKKAG